MSCKHEIVYKGVINISDAAILLGAIDVWRCRKCEKLFVEERRIGETKLEAKLGFEELEEGYKWGILVCRSKGITFWKVYKVKENSPLEHHCEFLGKLSLNIKEYKIEKPFLEDVEHTLYLLEDYINKVLEVSI